MRNAVQLVPRSSLRICPIHFHAKYLHVEFFEFSESVAADQTSRTYASAPLLPCE